MGFGSSNFYCVCRLSWIFLVRQSSNHVARLLIKAHTSSLWFSMFLQFKEPRLRKECSEVALHTLRTADSTEVLANRGPMIGRQAATVLREASIMLQYKLGRIRSTTASAPACSVLCCGISGSQATSGSVCASVRCQYVEWSPSHHIRTLGCN